MPSPPPRKRPIADFFRPYIKSNVPTKRPSPSGQERQPRPKSPDRDTSSIATPRAVRRSADPSARTPTSCAFSPLSAPGSRASLPIRSPRPHTPLDPPSTYKQPPRFGHDARPGPSSPTLVKPLSFTDLPSSTQAVVENGKVIEIRDSDDEGSDSLESLESLEDILGRTKGGHVTSMSSSPEGDDAKLEAERLKTLNLFTRSRSTPSLSKEKLRALAARERASQFDISGILNEHFDDQEVEQKIKRSRDDFNEALKASEAEKNTNLDKKLLAAVATTEDGEAGVSRLMDAVDRTEALTSDRVFLFFGANGLNDWHASRPPGLDFPEEAIPHQLWSPRDHEARSRAFLSGYMTELAAKGLLSDEGLRWIFQSVVLERRDDVRSAYIQCLRAASPAWTRNSLTPQNVHSIFQTLGADSANLLEGSLIEPRHLLLRVPPRRDPKYLLAAMEMFQAVSQDMDFLTLGNLTSTVCRLATDCELMSDARVCSAVEKMLETLLSLPELSSRSHVAERMMADLGHHLKDDTLQAHLLAHIPQTSPLACRVRILLAQSFLLGVDALNDGKSLKPQISLDVLAEHISTSPAFDTRRRTGPNALDYVALRALTYVLDVAISEGGRPATFASHAEEVSFNRSVDRLADSIRSIFVSIIDTGASHMTRTEAKDVLQALYWRLLYAVRTEVRPKKNIFDSTTGKARDGDEVRTEEKSKDFMKQFLAQRMEREQEKANRSEPTAVSRGEARVKSSTITSSEESSAPSETERLIRKQLDLSE
ncbi:hypothetical protein ABEF92_001596 [Exophiala dermatitidis]|uniref:Uncharacterized protein n=1 Tax=Exophiala dermatitidis (strain ATCC 34100 / CBS 525.76 / NIH/UT8656) TaxID=858893 RepID=H6BYR5_EXODN|nr:uncharacterized protein HMPREF1120_04844 [Exophiala dermatitidis NIH/UT8656]EHY56778.1 hypothetical protein HMPREF1120_04844 [Exophiala dermatitidis NIH/UT8656]